MQPNFDAVGYLRTTPPNAWDRVVEWVCRDRTPDNKYAVLIDSSTALLAFSLILANSMQEHKSDEIPEIPAGSLHIFEVWDNEVVRISNDDGMCPKTTYDEANAPIITKWLQLQHHNAQGTSEEMHYQLCEMPDASEDTPSKSLEEIIAERKAQERKTTTDDD